MGQGNKSMSRQINSHQLTAISLFCSGGIGDLAARDVGMRHLVANEMLEDRAEVFKHNFPEADVMCGDIWKLQEKIIERTTELLNGQELDFAIGTPPCQGMSSNGMGKLLQGIRDGRKTKWDPRNRLIIPTLNIFTALHPKVICFENVPGMETTPIQLDDGRIIGIIDYIRERLGDGYVGGPQVVEFADYGVPQMRQRLITVFSREEKCKRYYQVEGTFMPPITHSARDKKKKPYVTVDDVIGDFPPLDAQDEAHATSDIPYHRVPVLDKDKYFWVSNTPPGKGAMDNQCVECGYTGNPTHGAERINGINKSRSDTPIRCLRCGALLPRPWVIENGEYRLMQAFTSAYKRMRGDKPASALTRNLSYACSDHKLHPTQNRVLSLYEAFHIHTISDFKYEWKRADGKNVSDKTVREIIGESIPPRGLRVIYNHLVGILKGTILPAEKLKQGELF